MRIALYSRTEAPKQIARGEEGKHEHWPCIVLVDDEELVLSNWECC
jgi:hypothetical protein